MNFDSPTNGRSTFTAFDEGKYKAQVAIVQDVYKKYYRLLLEDDPNQLPPVLRQLENVNNAIKVLEKDRKSNAKTWMLTINPPEPYDWDHLEQVKNKLYEYKDFLIDPQEQYEQRSEDVEFPVGWHMHIACKLGRSKANTLDTVFSACKKIMPKISKSSLDLRRSQRAYAYVKGEKDDPSKNKKMEIDQILRDAHFLK